MAYLSKAAILAADDIKTAEVEVTEWGGTVRVRELIAEEIDAVGTGMVNAQGKVDASRADNLTVRVVAWGCIDENGKQLFKSSDVKALGKKSFEPVRRVATRILQMSNLNESNADPNSPQGDDSPSV